MKTSLKILHISKGYPPEIGGIETCVRDLAEAQAVAGHQVCVLAHAAKVPVGCEEIAGVSVQRCHTWYIIGRYAPLAPGLIWQCLKHILRPDLRPDIVHLHYPNLAATWLWFPFPAKLVVHWHADVTFPPEENPSPFLLALWRWFELRLLHRVDRIVVTSHPYLESSEALKEFKAKCRVIPLGLKKAPEQNCQNHPILSFFRKANGVCVLAVGRLVPYKGFRFLVEAVRQLPNAYLCIVGDGEDMPILQKLVTQHHLEERVFLAGSIPGGVLRACYQLCDIFALPSISRSEAFGLVLLEAMREGKPCVASNVMGSGMTEVVEQGITGLLTTPGDVDELVFALSTLADSPQLRESMGDAGRKRQNDTYTLEEMVRKIEKMYMSTLCSSSTRHPCC